MSIKINATGLDNKTISFTYNLSDKPTIKTLKSNIADKFNITDYNKVKLFFKGKVITDNNELFTESHNNYDYVYLISKKTENKLTQKSNSSTAKDQLINIVGSTMPQQSSTSTALSKDQSKNVGSSTLTDCSIISSSPITTTIIAPIEGKSIIDTRLESAGLSESSSDSKLTDEDKKNLIKYNSWSMAHYVACKDMRDEICQELSEIDEDFNAESMNEIIFSTIVAKHYDAVKQYFKEVKNYTDIIEIMEDDIKHIKYLSVDLGFDAHIAVLAYVINEKNVETAANELFNSTSQTIPTLERFMEELGL